MYSRMENSVSPIALILYLIVLVLVLASFWKLFTKAGQPGWYAIVPILNTVTYAGLGGVSCLFLLLLFVPIVNIFAIVYVHYKVAESFGQGLGFALGMWFLPFIFIPLLAFGDYQHHTQYDEWNKPKRKNDDDDNGIAWR